jgi:hypothetical protein
MYRWHFENCNQAPHPSQKIIEQREELRKRMIRFNNRKEEDID